MAFRVDVDAEGIIEIMRPVAGGENHHLRYGNKRSALNVMEHFIEQDLQQALQERFKPQLMRAAEKELAALQEKSPYDKK